MVIEMMEASENVEAEYGEISMRGHYTTFGVDIDLIEPVNEIIDV